MHPVDRGGRRLIPSAADGIKQVNIPGNPAVPAETVGHRPAGALLRVVKLVYPGIIERAGGRFGCLSGIGRKFVDPDNGDTDIGLWKRIYDGFQHRPGANLTSAGSGRGQQGQEAQPVKVLVEVMPQGLQGVSKGDKG